MKIFITSRSATFVIAVALLTWSSFFHSGVAYSQPRRTYTVLIHPAPPPDNPNEWVIVVRTDSNMQGWYTAGYHPSGLGSFDTADQAGSAADKLVLGRFARECRRSFSIFFHGITRERIVVPEFGEKPYGFHLERAGLCEAEALAMIGFPMSYTLLGSFFGLQGLNVQFTLNAFNDQFRFQPPDKPGVIPLLVKTPPSKKPPVSEPGTVSEVQREVEEIPVKPPSGGSVKPPVVEEIPETPPKTPPPTTPPIVEEIPEAPVVTAPPQAPPQPGPQTLPPTQPQPTTSSIDTSGDWIVRWNWSVTDVIFVGKITGGGSQWNFQGNLVPGGIAQGDLAKGSGTIACSLSGQPDSPNTSGKMSCTASFPGNSWQGEADGMIQVRLFGEKQKFEFRGTGKGNANGGPPAGIGHLDLKPKD